MGAAEMNLACCLPETTCMVASREKNVHMLCTKLFSFGSTGSKSRCFSENFKKLSRSSSQLGAKHGFTLVRFDQKKQEGETTSNGISGSHVNRGDLCSFNKHKRHSPRWKRH